MQFRDRTDAGRQLAQRLSHLADADALVLALPRGGVPVALEIARLLDAPLDVIGVRKLGAPGQPEFGIGAVAEGGVQVIDDASTAALRLLDEDIEEIARQEFAELHRRVGRYRGGRALPDFAGKSVVVVDDGLATGVTARAALEAVRGRDPRRTILAVPVGAPETVARMRDFADDVVVIHQPPEFMAVGAWYERFDQTSDDEVLRALEERAASPTGKR